MLHIQINKSSYIVGINTYNLLLINFSTSMSWYRKKPSSMHSSQIIYKQTDPVAKKQIQGMSKLSQFQTKESSQFESYDIQQYANLVENYQKKLINMQIGFQRSKQQFENTIKQVYRQKIILLNIISHNQDLVDEFRSKVRMDPQVNFKEVETKYNIISSSLFHNQLCSNCILKISKAQNLPNLNIQTVSSNKAFEQQVIKKFQSKSKKQVRKLMTHSKQFSWMYAPNEQFRVLVTNLKGQITKLKKSLEDFSQENTFRMNQKNNQIQLLKAQITKLSANASKIVHISYPKQMVCLQNRQKCLANLELLKQAQKKIQESKINRVIYEQAIKELNQRLVVSELERLNSKYRIRCL